MKQRARNTPLAQVRLDYFRVHVRKGLQDGAGKMLLSTPFGEREAIRSRVIVESRKMGRMMKAAIDKLHLPRHLRDRMDFDCCHSLKSFTRTCSQKLLKPADTTKKQQKKQAVRADIIAECLAEAFINVHTQEADKQNGTQ